MRIFIGGDFCPENRAENKLIKNEDLFEGKLKKKWNYAHYRVLNLEGSITNSTEKIIKIGRHIKFNPDITTGLQEMNVNAFSLANNHIMDFGVKGYNDTVEALNNAKIDFFGCSDNKYKILEKNNIRVALLSFTNNEFSIKSGHEGKGAYPIDLIDILQTLESVKEITDNIIIILHTGLSKFPLPSPEQKKLCRFLIDQGATSVLCQHSHVIGAYEYYKDGFISYGQGSFVFDGMRRNSYMNKGYSLLFTFKPKSMDVDIIPHKQFDDLPLVRTLREEEFEVFKDEVGVYNKILQNEKLFKKEWSNYLNINRKYYFNQFFYQRIE